MKRDVEDPPIATDTGVRSRRIAVKLVGNAFFVLLIVIAAIAGAVSPLFAG